jgi:hypothetical protein
MPPMRFHPQHRPITFDPNDNSATPWASYIPGRNGPDFKVHRTRGNALNAFSGRNHGVVYMWDMAAHRWREVLRREHGAYPDMCDDCGTPLGRDERHAFYGRDGSWVIVRDRSNKPIEPIQQKYICNACKKGY